MTRRLAVVLLAIVILTSLIVTLGSWLFDGAWATRPQQESQDQLRPLDRTGVLIPMYVYPANIEENPAYGRLLELKRKYKTVAMWVIVNPASGPGKRVDVNYTEAIGRLSESGCVVLGYVTTSYAKRSLADVRKDIDQWQRMYPRVEGIFFDEMIHEDTEAGANYQAALNQYAREVGCRPTVANPGAGTPSRYFAASAADVTVVHEESSWPTEGRLRAYELSQNTHDPLVMLGILLHSQPMLDRAQLRTVLKHARWVYVTEGVYRRYDPGAGNPWDRLSGHLDEICECLSEKIEP